MRVSRAVSLLMAALLALTLSQALVSPSQAAHGHSAVAAKAKTKVSIHFAANGGKAFRLYGTLTPRKKNKVVTLLRSTKANSGYRNYKTSKTNKSGNYTFSGLKLEGYYAVKVSGVVSKVIHVCKGGCG